MDDTGKVTTCRPWMAFVAIITTLAIPSGAAAAEMNPILGLDIGGTLYDVSFHPGNSFNDLWDQDDDNVFGGGSSVFVASPTFWQDQAGALLATQAIIGALGNAGTTTGTYDGFLVPYAWAPNISPLQSAVHVTADDDPQPGSELLASQLTISQFQVPAERPYASFTPAGTRHAIPALSPALLIPAVLIVAAAGMKKLRRKSVSPGNSPRTNTDP